MLRVRGKRPEDVVSCMKSQKICTSLHNARPCVRWESGWLLSRPTAEKVGKAPRPAGKEEKAPSGRWQRAQWPGSRAKGLLNPQA